MSTPAGPRLLAVLTSLPCPVLQDSQLLQEEFGLATSEELLERFPCSMLQTYTCLHNPFTPNQQVCPAQFEPDGRSAHLHLPVEALHAKASVPCSLYLMPAGAELQLLTLSPQEQMLALS